MEYEQFGNCEPYFNFNGKEKSVVTDIVLCDSFGGLKWAKHCLFQHFTGWFWSADIRPCQENASMDCFVCDKLHAIYIIQMPHPQSMTVYIPV